MIVVDMNQKNEWGFCFVRVKGVRTLINLLAFVEIHNPRTDPNGTKLRRLTAFSNGEIDTSPGKGHRLHPGVNRKETYVG